MTNDRSFFLKSIAQRIADYRAHDGFQIGTVDHVDKWVGQFGKNFQLPILSELDHVLSKTYYGKDFIKGFLSKIITNEDITGNDVNQFWKNANLIEIQDDGSSQSDFLKIFSESLQNEVGFDKGQCGNGNDIFVYIDDAIFSGRRFRDDIVSWISNEAPKNATLYVVVIALYSGYYWALKRIQNHATELGKNINVEVYRCIELENKRSNKNVSDVFWPTAIPDDQKTKEHAEMVNSKYEIEFREGTSLGTQNVFKTDQGRKILEQEFLVKGVEIYNFTDNFPDLARPLGFSNLTTLGFGSTVVTYRNCPNNAPLAMWAGVPWYPLFPRKQNSQRQSVGF